MTTTALSAPTLDDALDVIELLPLEDQNMLIEIVQRRYEVIPRKSLSTDCADFTDKIPKILKICG